MSFTSASHRAPRTAESGGKGEFGSFRLELKLIADVGIIGYPNAGKSTFISVVSAAKPKIADYPFTTKVPNLSVVKDAYGGGFVLADMPGLIDGAHAGVGLGLEFLKHIERIRLLLHFVDTSVDTDMTERYLAIRRELELYSPDVALIDEIAVGTKCELAVGENLENFRKFLAKDGKPLFVISSHTKIGVAELISNITTRL
jgi:GTP-binding protein